jgi:hypothetical protein
LSRTSRARDPPTATRGCPQPSSRQTCNRFHRSARVLQRPRSSPEVTKDNSTSSSSVEIARSVPSRSGLSRAGALHVATHAPARRQISCALSAVPDLSQRQMGCPQPTPAPNSGAWTPRRQRPTTQPPDLDRRNAADRQPTTRETSSVECYVESPAHSLNYIFGSGQSDSSANPARAARGPLSISVNGPRGDDVRLAS